MAVCRVCNQDYEAKPGYISFHMCKGKRMPELPPHVRLATAFIEGSTEYDFDELPGYLKEIIGEAAVQFLIWKEKQDKPIMGEVVNEQKAIE